MLSMTAPDPETLEREKDKLWVTDAEMIRRLGVPEKVARTAIRMLDRMDPTFPKKHHLWGDRRYWPALRYWFDDRYGAASLPHATRQAAQHAPQADAANTTRVEIAKFARAGLRSPAGCGTLPTWRDFSAY
jgi:hypothetical protein